jgi:hypothetical protein
MLPEIFDATADVGEPDQFDEEAWLDEDWDADYWDADYWDADSAELAEALRDVLSDDYADADADAIDDALGEMMDSLSAAEAFNFAKAFKQIEKSAKKLGVDKVLGQVAGIALPIAGGAVGTLVGGPVGTALGSGLGNAAAGALTGRRPTRPAVPGIAGGSAAAAQGLVLTQQPDVLKGLLALSMGQHGQKAVNGVPVAKIMNMLSSVFGQAAADADELMYLGENRDPTDSDESTYGAYTDQWPLGRELYTTLLDADNAELADAMESL